MNVSEKMKAQQELPPIKKVETDFNNINLSRDQFEEKYRKKKEIEGKLALEKLRLEREFAEEEKKAEKSRLAKEKELRKAETEE